MWKLNSANAEVMHTGNSFCTYMHSIVFNVLWNMQRSPNITVHFSHIIITMYCNPCIHAAGIKAGIRIIFRFGHYASSERGHGATTEWGKKCWGKPHIVCFRLLRNTDRPHFKAAFVNTFTVRTTCTPHTQRVTLGKTNTLSRNIHPVSVKNIHLELDGDTGNANL